MSNFKYVKFLKCQISKMSNVCPGTGFPPLFFFLNSGHLECPGRFTTSSARKKRFKVALYQGSGKGGIFGIATTSQVTSLDKFLPRARGGYTCVVGDNAQFLVSLYI